MNRLMLALLLLIPLALPTHADLVLRQSTATEIPLGPYTDSTDGNTDETALTISQADVRLKKCSQSSCGAWAQKSDTSACTHEEAGWYECPLNATDTNTVGILWIATHESGALHVWGAYQIAEEGVYDACCASGASPPAADGSSFTAIPWNSAWDAEVESEVDDSLGGGTGTALTAIPWNASWDAEVQSEATDALNAYDPPTNAEMTARTLASASYATAATQTTMDGKLDTISTAVVTTIPAAVAVIDGIVDQLLVGVNVTQQVGIDICGSGTEADPWGACP